MLYILAENKLWWATDRLKSVYGLCFHALMISSLSWFILFLKGSITDALSWLETILSAETAE